MSDAIAESHEGRLGCSELSAALGVIPWKTPFMLWSEKTGRAEPPDIGGMLRIQLGNRLEAIVSDLYEEQTGQRVFRNSVPFRHPSLPIVGNIDRRIIRKRGGLEIKTALGRFPSSEWGEPGTDQIPLHYLLQCMGYLMLTGWDWWDVAVLLAGPEIRIYRVHPDPDAFDAIEQGVRAFWKYVETDVPPPNTTLADCAARWPLATGTTVEATAGDVEAVSELRRIKSEIAGLEKIAEKLEIGIKGIVKDSAGLTHGGKTLCTWKKETRKHVDLKSLRHAHPGIVADLTTETASRVFRLVKEKTE